MTRHNIIQAEIVATCIELNLPVKQERRGKGWRADVFVELEPISFAFEIQLSHQTLKRTLERQAKYEHDNITGCWFFETPVSKLNGERPDLPLFYVEKNADTGKLMVNLAERRKIELTVFLKNFITGNIIFQTAAKTKPLQFVELSFYYMKCWKCKEYNHLYFVSSPFYSDCNARIKPDEFLWDSSSIEYRPEIVELVKMLHPQNEQLIYPLATIKERFSHTVGHSYLSFGCAKCDSIFGDFHVMDAKIDVMYCEDLIKMSGEINLENEIKLEIPHWCFPGDNGFCSGKAI